MYTIGEFAKITGYTQQTLRNWEQSGKLIPTRLGGDLGHRRYTQEQLDTILQKETNKTKGQEKKTIGFFKVSNQIQPNSVSEYYDKLRLYLSNTFEETFDILCDVYPNQNSGDNLEQLNELLNNVTKHQIKCVVFLCTEPLDYYEYKSLSNLLTKLNIQVTILKNNVLSSALEFDDLITSIQDLVETKTYTQQDIVEIVALLEENLAIPTESTLTELD